MRSKYRRFAILAVTILAAAGITTAVYAASRGASPGGVPEGSPSAAASISISNCKAGRSDFITNDLTSLSTTSTSYVAVPGMTKTIAQGGRAPSCVLVAVSAFGFASGGLEYVSVMLDGALGSPIETQFAGDSGNFAEAHAALFAFPSVAPGTHTVAMVFRSLSGSQVTLHRPAMRIDHR